MNGCTGGPGTNMVVTSANEPLHGKYLKFSGRGKPFRGAVLYLDQDVLSVGCLLSTPTYLFSAKARLTSTQNVPSVCSTKTVSVDSENRSLNLRLLTMTPRERRRTRHSLSTHIWCGPFHFAGAAKFTDQDLASGIAYSSLVINGPEGGIDISLDNVTLALPSNAKHSPTQAHVFTELVRNGNADLNGANIYPFQTSFVKDTNVSIGTAYVGADGNRNDSLPDNGGISNPYFKITGRTQEFARLQFEILKGCVSSSNRCLHAGHHWIDD